MKNNKKQTFTQWTYDILGDTIEQHFYVKDSDMLFLMLSVFDILNQESKLRNTTEDLLTYEEYLKFTKDNKGEDK